MDKKGDYGWRGVYPRTDTGVGGVRILIIHSCLVKSTSVKLASKIPLGYSGVLKSNDHFMNFYRDERM